VPKKPEQLKKEATEAVSELLQSVVEQKEAESGERVPGGTIRGSKIPWTRGDVERRFPKVTFVPEESIPVTFNGITYQLREGEDNTVPSCIKVIYDDHRKRERMIGRNMSGVVKSQYSGEL
jgi:hypothetical protein